LLNLTDKGETQVVHKNLLCTRQLSIRKRNGVASLLCILQEELPQGRSHGSTEFDDFFVHILAQFKDIVSGVAVASIHSRRRRLWSKQIPTNSLR
jgi:hypothetical protein